MLSSNKQKLPETVDDNVEITVKKPKLSIITTAISPITTSILPTIPIPSILPSMQSICQINMYS